MDKALDYTDKTDEELMALMAGADHRAAAALVARHQRGLLNLFWRYTGDRMLAEDLAQEVFLRVYKSAPLYEPRAPFSVWLYRIAKNVCFNELAARRVRHRPQMAQPQMAEAEAQEHAASPHEAVERAQREVRVRQAVEALPERQRLAIVLQRYHALSLAEVAEVMETTPEAVEALLARAKDKLRHSLADLLG